jgi:hypothetical protein
MEEGVTSFSRYTFWTLHLLNPLLIFNLFLDLLILYGKVKFFEKP